MQLDGRITTAELADERHQLMQDKRRGGIDSENALRLLATGEQLVLSRGHLVEEVGGAAIEPVALVGQRDATGGAVEQLGGQLLLEAFDAAADHRIVDAEIIGGLAKATRLDHGDKQRQLIGMTQHCCSIGNCFMTL